MKHTPETPRNRTFLSIILTVAAALAVNPSNAKVIVYEGFCHAGNPSPERVGWLTNWRQGDGEVKHIGNDLKYEALASCAGAIQLQGSKVTVASQLDTPLSGITYGSVRIKTGQIKPDSVIAITFAGPETEDVVPKNSTIGLLLKDWRQELGTISRKSTKSENKTGAPIESNTDYLLLWQMEQPKQLTMWILNVQQAEHYVKNGLSPEQLEKASSGMAAENIMQRVSSPLSKNLDVDRGYLLSCFAFTCTGTLFDEIRISDSSLAEAAGM